MTVVVVILTVKQCASYLHVASDFRYLKERHRKAKSCILLNLLVILPLTAHSQHTSVCVINVQNEFPLNVETHLN